MTKKGLSPASSSAALNSSFTNENGTPIKELSATAQGRFVCSMCAKVYRSGAGLRYHKRKRHRGMVEPTALHRVKCQEIGCTYQMLAISDLRNHLSNHHQKPEYKCTEEKKFTSLSDFTEWKSSFEQRTGSKYVKNCGAKGKSDNQTTEYYYCNRTGPYKSVGQGLRRSKAQGLLRCGIHCTSSMKVEIQNDENITVQYYPAHYGHTHLPATEEPSDQEFFRMQHDQPNSGGSGGGGGGSGGGVITNIAPHHVDDSTQNLLQQFPCNSSSSSPSASSSSSSSTNSTNAQILTSSQDSSQISTPSTTLTSMNNQLSHCIIISPSYMEQHDQNIQVHSEPQHSIHQHTLHTHQNLLLPPSVPQQFPILVHPAPMYSTDVLAKKPVSQDPNSKSVSEIMRETFQLLSYWPLDSTILVGSQTEHIHPQQHFNMDEHLMF
ncbi:unnamed protein product [Didymodactylos carnosus]|uniref:C2H2-type domain-containing protein n=1 Tax=Didymodactylos carnosus TaxID=1234261 RepID=A0A813TB37_9BILA|nr:unnamed protein product [Didymodactylos carnosus]CAF0810112.1 unnamed protein product [Didymodactylos carnosus]CAF3532305.1 unnamed protein product [Didymodactylos carnosus]CAF3595713.1 unnamed protein product [Didymodactylos carnosus]